MSIQTAILKSLATGPKTPGMLAQVKADKAFSGRMIPPIGEVVSSLLSSGLAQHDGNRIAITSKGLRALQGVK